MAGITEDSSVEMPTPPAVNHAPSAPAPVVTQVVAPAPVVTPVVAPPPVVSAVPAEPAATSVAEAPAIQSYPSTLTLTAGAASAEPATSWVDVESTNPSE